MPRPPINRPMTFTGCWTCKSRKIRCDERPVTCGNCERRGITCGGYDIRLQWVSDPYAELSVSRGKGRRSIKLDDGTGGQYRMDEIDDFLHDIDNADTGFTARKGPFSIFPMQNDSLASTHTPITPAEVRYVSSNSIDETWDGSPVDDMSVQLSNPDQPMALIPSERDDNWPMVMYDIRSASVAGTEGSGGIVDSETSLDSSPRSLDEFSITHRHSTASSPDHSLLLSTSSSPNELNINFPLIQHLTTSLSGDAEVDSLIHHYGVHMADLLLPISHVQNIYRQLYLSTALEGSLTPVPNSNTPKALAHTALYHSILSSSAYHIWYCNKSQTKYQMIGASNRNQAIRYLQSAVNTSAPNADYKLFMVAILSLITIGIMSGEVDDFSVHITGATQLRTSRRGWSVVSRSTRQLNDISAFLALLARTTAFQTSPLPWLGPSQVALLADEGLKQSSSCYEYLYGITPSIAAAIQETCILAEILTQFEGQPPHSTPDDLREACEALGDKLLSWTLESLTIVSIPANDDLMQNIFKHHATAWHYAALIYYYRRIQHCDSTELVQEIRCVAEHMHAVEEIKTQSNSNLGDTMAPITWPAFIASCEALGEDRNTWRRWWEGVEHYKIANIRKQWEIVQVIWAEMEQKQQRGSCSEDWINVFRRLGCHVLPV